MGCARAQLLGFDYLQRPKNPSRRCESFNVTLPSLPLRKVWLSASCPEQVTRTTHSHRTRKHVEISAIVHRVALQNCLFQFTLHFHLPLGCNESLAFFCARPQQRKIYNTYDCIVINELWRSRLFRVPRGKSAEGSCATSFAARQAAYSTSGCVIASIFKAVIVLVSDEATRRLCIFCVLAIPPQARS